MNLEKFKSDRRQTSASRWVWMLIAFSRFEFLRKFAFKRIQPDTEILSPSESTICILAGGDVCLDTAKRNPHFLGAYVLKEPEVKNPRLAGISKKLLRGISRLLLSPRFFSTKYYAHFPELLVKTPENEKRMKRKVKGEDSLAPFFPDGLDARSKYSAPFAKIKSLFKEKDIVIINLETPISDNPRVHGYFVSAPPYARAMKEAGVTIACLANNHAFDAGEIGFSHTLRHLKENDIAFTGGGENFEEARKGTLIEHKGIRFLFLGYNQFCIHRYLSFAAEYAGILPLDRELMVKDIQAARARADFIIVSLHWGFEDQPSVHSTQVEIAHLLVDAGADALIGHHPHVPHAIEIYKKRPIIYSLGNFIFGHGRPEWTDNFLAEILVENRRVEGLRIYPISGKGKELFQPELLKGERACSLLEELQIKSAIFDTRIAIHDGIGCIKIE